MKLFLEFRGNSHQRNHTDTFVELVCDALEVSFFDESLRVML